MPDDEVKTLYSATKAGSKFLYAHHFVSSGTVQCFVLAAQLMFQNAPDRAKWSNHVHSDISGTQVV